MAHIVCITSGLRGLLNASFELARRLQAADHAVTCASPWDCRAVVEAQGVSFVPLDPVRYSDIGVSSHGYLSSLRARWRERRTTAARRASGHTVADLQPFRSAIDRLQPDLVLLDIELYEFMLALWASETPLLLVTPFFPTWQYPGVPPLQQDLTPGQGWRGSRAGTALAWQRQRLASWARAIRISLRQAFSERRSRVRQLARDLGYPLRDLDEYGSHTMFNERRLPVLTLTARELDFAHETRPDLHYVGPMVALDRRDEPLDRASRARLDDLFARGDDDGRPLVYFALTTMSQSAEDLLARVIDAFADAPTWRLAVGNCPAGWVDRVAPADDLQLFEYLPQIELLRRAALCITSGGINTIHECIELGVPMLIYPQRYDQPGNLARMAHHGLAHRGDPGDRPADIARRVGLALADDSLTTRLAETRTRLAHYVSDRVLEKTVDAYLGATG